MCDHTHTSFCGLHAVREKEKKSRETMVDYGKVINNTRRRKYLCEKPAGPFSLLKL